MRLNGAPDSPSGGASKSPSTEFAGVRSCQSSACHGGALASPAHRQCAVWRQEDPHAHAFATLTTAYSARIVESLGIASAANSPRCTICHAPLSGHRTTGNPVVDLAEEGVSCEACHNPAQSWLRFHTRYDLTYAERVDRGLRDLRNLNVRAGTCVACHLVLPDDLLRSGHPALHFELAALTRDEPPHWNEKQPWVNTKSWLIGQAVALRSIVEQRPESRPPSPSWKDRSAALLWLLRQVGEPTFPKAPTDPRQLEESSRTLARTINRESWTQSRVQDLQLKLLEAAPLLARDSISSDEVQDRARGLLDGVDQCALDLRRNGDATLRNKLGTEVDASNGFDSTQFSSDLKRYSDSLK